MEMLVVAMGVLVDIYGCLGRYLRKMLCPLLTLRVSREEVGGLHNDSGSKPASVSEGHVIARQGARV